MSSGPSKKGWDDEMLLAYADNELDAGQAAALETVIRNDPEAQALLEHFRRSAAGVRHAFDAPLAEKVPERLLAALEPPSSNAVPLAGRRGVFETRRVLLPLAASLLALFLGFAGGYLYRGGDAQVTPASSPGDHDADHFASALRRALDGGNAGVSIDYEIPQTSLRGSVMIVGPVESGLGIPCQAFRHETVRDGAASSSVGLACRQADGAWSVLTVPTPGS